MRCHRSPRTASRDGRPTWWTPWGARRRRCRPGHISLSTVEKNLNTVFDKLGLAHATGYNRRILAVLRYLES